MKNRSKSKGKTFEREICVFLSSLYEDSFTRVPDSGSFVGGKNSFRKSYLSEAQVKAHKGDIIPPDHWCSFNAECKNYGEFPFHHLLSNRKIPLLENWIDQTLSAEDSGDCSAIFIKITRRGRYIMYKLPQEFVCERYVDYMDVNENVWRMTDLDDFFKLNKKNYENACTNEKKKV